MAIFCYDRLESLVCVLDNKNSDCCPFYDGRMYEVLNGQFTIEFSAPYSHPDAQKIVQGGYVIARDNNETNQLFVITRIEDSHGTYAERTVYGEHASIELLDEIVQQLLIPIDSDPTYALTQILSGSKWLVGNVNDTTKITTTPFIISNVDRKKALNQFAERWIGDMTFRTVLTQGQSFTRYVDWDQMKGVNTGRRFEYSKDIVDISREIDTSRIKTALIGVGGNVTSRDQPTLLCTPLTGGQFTWQITGLGGNWDDDNYYNATIFNQPFDNFQQDTPAGTADQIYPPTAGTNKFTPVTTTTN